MTLYSDQTFKPNVPGQQQQKEPDFIFYFIILYKCTLQPATCMENWAYRVERVLSLGAQMSYSAVPNNLKQTTEISNEMYFWTIIKKGPVVMVSSEWAEQWAWWVITPSRPDPATANK